MSFSGKNDDITLLTVVDCPGDRLFPIRYLDVFTIRFFDAGPDVRNNVQWFSKRGLSDVMIVRSASLPETSPISNLLDLARFPPHPNRHTSLFG